MQCDVLVAGGGSAGLAAAISAARTGAKTVLVEHSGMLGGMAPLSLVHSICGLFKISSQPEVEWANPGFPREFATRLLEMNGARAPVRMGRVDVMQTEPTAFSLLADLLCAETPNLEVRFHSTIIGAESDLTRMEISCRGRREFIGAKAAIDCTGDGCLAAMAGAEVEQESSDKLQRPAYIFTIQGVAPSAISDDARIKIARHIADAVQKGELPRTALGVSFREGAHGGEIYVSIDLPGTNDFDPLDARCLTDLEFLGRQIASSLVKFLSTRIAGFSATLISRFPARIGVRESRRIRGKYRLETSDIESGATFPDTVALATWPIELRETAKGPRLRFPHENRPCEIPIRALQARAHDNLFMAGRCISCSHEAQASIRVIGTCLATGEAAGIAAARLVK